MPHVHIHHTWARNIVMRNIVMSWGSQLRVGVPNQQKDADMRMVACTPSHQTGSASNHAGRMLA
eukprot:CAMPEP_0174693904 /NCGR_PEP_ID=MMETSP1094-20130205/540_1 /TAXON_ID=156173 /ORGANISM="Chrysochromulina brevifilum, Strain UTEX LB 985" /LENGTH=63 /DNA_ID=CAMNT_0015889957 /DNA_START=87 /DNA_END=278 /DNA_ORIENTATION=-